MLRPQDPILLLRILTAPNREWNQIALGSALELSQAEVHKALKRLAESGLYERTTKRAMRQRLLEFLIHGLKYAFPARLGGPARGVSTAWAAPPLSAEITGGAASERPVWAHPQGKVRGARVTPLYKTVPEIALRDRVMHEVLALVDAIRIGRARERNLAEKLLRERLSA